MQWLVVFQQNYKGKFGHGFVAAGFASAAKTPMYNQWGVSPEYRVHRVTTAAVIGGTASVISGGKFANGAVTGAFVQLFNGERQLRRANISQKYSALRDRVVKYAGENPESVIELSLEDISVMKDAMSLYAAQVPKYTPFSDGFNAQFAAFDTFIYKNGLASRVFSVDGVNYMGGDINYIGVGAFFEAYGFSIGFGFARSLGWNMKQYFAGEGSHNLTQHLGFIKAI